MTTPNNNKKISMASLKPMTVWDKKPPQYSFSASFSASVIFEKLMNLMIQKIFCRSTMQKYEFDFIGKIWLSVLFLYGHILFMLIVCNGSYSYYY
jgi:hypothetical protein